MLVIVLWIIGAVGVTVLVKSVGADTSNNVDLPGTGSQLATDLLQAGFPPQQNGSNPIIFNVTKGKVTDSANKQAITDSYKAIKKIHFVHSAVSPFSQDGRRQISKDKKTAFISVLLKHQLERAHRGRGAAGDERRRARDEGRDGGRGRRLDRLHPLPQRHRPPAT